MLGVSPNTFEVLVNGYGYRNGGTAEYEFGLVPGGSLVKLPAGVTIEDLEFDAPSSRRTFIKWMLYVFHLSH